MDNELILHLGVVEANYKNGQANDFVAKILEGKYGIMQTFADMHKDEIEKLLVDSLLNAPISDSAEYNPFSQAEEGIKDLFTFYIDKAEHGIQVKAAESGTTKRKGKQSGHAARAPFVDTGLYRGSFIAWVD